MSFFYIASPYTHKEASVREKRFKEAMKFTAALMKLEIPCYSPIVHCHELANTYELPTTFDYWIKMNHAMIDVSLGVVVLKLDGWDTSKGVADEIEYAKSRYQGWILASDDPLDHKLLLARYNNLTDEVPF